MKQPGLKDNIQAILHGTADEKEKLKSKFFYLADTSRFMQEKGLTGDFFSMRYGVITRHTGKDADHGLTEQNWINLCDRITDPFAIARHGNTFRVFTDVKTNDRNIIAGVDVKNVGKNLEVNSVSTAFGFRNRPIQDEIIYRSKKITPEQTALLDEPNALSLPPAQEAVTTVSPDYGEKSSGIRNKNNNKEHSMAKQVKGEGVTEKQLEAAKKAGYVQGVCECVAAVGDDTTMAKKLLTEMKVTKTMAKQFAKPETYEALEQGVFAPKQEQQQQLSRGVKR